MNQSGEYRREADHTASLSRTRLQGRFLDQLPTHTTGLSTWYRPCLVSWSRSHPSAGLAVKVDFFRFGTVC